MTAQHANMPCLPQNCKSLLLLSSLLSFIPASLRLNRNVQADGKQPTSV